MSYPRFQLSRGFKRTVYKHSADYTNSTNVLADIDLTNVPPLGLYLQIGDVVEMSLDCQILQTSAGNVILLDWMIDRPVSADVLVSALLSEACAGLWYPQSGNYELPLHLVRSFVATEAGEHTFRPQYKTNGTGTAKILMTGVYGRALEHMVKNLGPVDPN